LKLFLNERKILSDCPDISQTKWVFGINIKNHDFLPLGCAIRDYQGNTKYITNWEELLKLVSEHDELLAHNAQYDLGCLRYLITLFTAYSAVLDNKPIHDTILLYKLYDNTLFSYSLDNLAKKYLKVPKGHNILIDIVWNNDLYPYLKKELKEKVLVKQKLSFSWRRKYALFVHSHSLLPHDHMIVKQLIKHVLS